MKQKSLRSCGEYRQKEGVRCRNGQFAFAMASMRSLGRPLFVVGVNLVQQHLIDFSLPR